MPMLLVFFSILTTLSLHKIVHTDRENLHWKMPKQFRNGYTRDHDHMEAFNAMKAVNAMKAKFVNALC